MSSSNTGSTDLRDTEVQQPNTAATLSRLMSSRAFSANSGQFEAGSTTTGSIFLPSSPPLAFWSAICISIRSFKMVSLIAIVPDSECRIPTLMVSCAATCCDVAPTRRSGAASSASQGRRSVFMGNILCIAVAEIDFLDRPRMPTSVPGNPARAESRSEKSARSQNPRESRGLGARRPRPLPRR